MNKFAYDLLQKDAATQVEMARRVDEITNLINVSTPVNAVAAALTTSLAGANNDMVFTAKTKGEAGNNIKIKYTDPGEETAGCTAAITGLGTVASPYIIDVTLKYTTDAITATAANVKSAIEALPAANALVGCANAGADSGAGVVTALAATALTGGVDGTEGVAEEVLYNDNYIYICLADNTIADDNWRRISLGSAY